MERYTNDTYAKYLNSLYRFMVKEGYTSDPKPRVVIEDKPQDEEVFISTGYYNPDDGSVHLFTYGRHIKDILRSFAHELIHHRQDVEGRLSEGSYSGQRIVDDRKLVGLEEEAYKDGNIAFRRWTETVHG